MRGREVEGGGGGVDSGARFSAAAERFCRQGSSRFPRFCLVLARVSRDDNFAHCELRTEHV